MHQFPQHLLFWPGLSWNFAKSLRKKLQWHWFHHITWCILVESHPHNLCDAESRAMDRALQNVDYKYGLTDMACLPIQHVVCNKQHFVRKLRILSKKDFWDLSQWLGRGGVYHHQQQP